jgi:hypothetical protein
MYYSCFIFRSGLTLLIDSERRNGDASGRRRCVISAGRISLTAASALRVASCGSLPLPLRAVRRMRRISFKMIYISTMGRKAVGWMLMRTPTALGPVLVAVRATSTRQ